MVNRLFQALYNFYFSERIHFSKEHLVSESLSSASRRVQTQQNTFHPFLSVKVFPTPLMVLIWSLICLSASIKTSCFFQFFSLPCVAFHIDAPRTSLRSKSFPTPPQVLLNEVFWNAFRPCSKLPVTQKDSFQYWYMRSKHVSNLSSQLVFPRPHESNTNTHLHEFCAFLKITSVMILFFPTPPSTCL